jgi:hypothetical protein
MKIKKNEEGDFVLAQSLRFVNHWFESVRSPAPMTDAVTTGRRYHSK